MRHARTSPYLLAHALLVSVTLLTSAARAQSAPIGGYLDPSAEVVARLDVARLRGAPSYRAIEGVLVETLGDAGVDDAHAREVLARVDECVVSGRVADLDAEQVLLVARGRFTLEDTSRLVAQPGVTLETRRDHRVLRRGRRAAVFVGNDRFVFGDAALVLDALDRIDRREPATATPHPLPTRLGVASSETRMLRVVAAIEGELAREARASLAGTSLVDATSIVVEADIGAQLDVAITLALRDASRATSAVAELTAMAREAAALPVVRTMGLSNALRALRFRASGASVVITGRLRDADVRRLATALGAELGPAPETQTSPPAPRR